MTSETPDRRCVARLTIPWQHFTRPGLELRPVRLLDLSSLGVRIEHAEPLHEGVVCYADLPPALGRASLTARVVWTKLHKAEQTFEGDKHRYYQSGLVFVGLTPEQQQKLAVALQTLKASE
jgi:hypothetical protein